MSKKCDHYYGVDPLSETKSYFWSMTQLKDSLETNFDFEYCNFKFKHCPKCGEKLDGKK